MGGPLADLINCADFFVHIEVSKIFIETEHRADSAVAEHLVSVWAIRDQDCIAVKRDTGSSKSVLPSRSYLKLWTRRCRSSATVDSCR